MLSHVSPEPSTTISPRRRTLAMAVLIGASFMDLFDVTIMQVALPSIRNDLHADAAQLEWIIAGYMLAFASMLITGGRLGDASGDDEPSSSGSPGSPSRRWPGHAA